MSKLSQATLSQLPAGVGRPAYDRSAVKTGVLHFGPGAFHRAHQAAAFDTLLGHDPRWGITGVSLNSTGVADALNPQDGLYALALLDMEPDLRVIGSVRHILTRADQTAIMAALSSPDTRIVSSTVTEKGYCLNGAGELDFDHAAIQHDLKGPAVPQSFIGWLVAGLATRRQAGVGGLNILSCDNLTDNGRKLGAAVRAFAQSVDPDTARWIADEVRFPNAMVDSITPATDEAVRQSVCAQLGLDDVWPIQRERFTQWVIEDDFAGERPALELAGVTFTDDVHGFEAAKLRLLNGAHSSLAYIGLGRGHGSVAQAMRDPQLAGFVERLMRQDIVPSVAAPQGLDLDDYIAAILRRFANPAIEHKLSQIAWDGSQKLPYRLLGTVRDALAAGRPIDRLAVPIAAWLRFIARAAERGEAITDPLADALLARGSDWQAILDMREIFGDLSDHAGFRAAVQDGFALLDGADLDRADLGSVPA